MTTRHTFATAAALVALSLLGTPSMARAGDKTPTAAPAKPPPQRYRRVIHSIELAASKKEPFRGAITLKLTSNPSAMLTYYWGGECKRTRLSGSQIALLFEAMRRKMAVEIPSRAIRYAGRVRMCIRSIRVLAE